MMTCFQPLASDNVYVDIDAMISEDAHHSKISLHRMDDQDADRDLLDKTAFGADGLHENGLCWHYCFHVFAAISSWTTHKGGQIKLFKTNFALGSAERIAGMVGRAQRD